MIPPKEVEINPGHDLWDGQTAVEHFLGKSVSDAEAFFRNHECDYIFLEDLDAMGPRAFCYYVPGSGGTRRSPGGFALRFFGNLPVLDHLESPAEGS
jgi:hypothetical protein